MSASLVNVLQRIYANLVIIAPSRIEFHEIKVKVYFSPHVPALFFESMHYVKPNFEKINISLPLPEVSVANIERCVFIAVLDHRPWIRILSQNAQYKIFCCESHHIVLLTNKIALFLGSHAPEYVISSECDMKHFISSVYHLYWGQGLTCRKRTTSKYITI